MKTALRKTTQSLWDEFPYELLWEILMFLGSPQEILKCLRVCKDWYVLSKQENAIVARFYQETLESVSKTLKSRKDFKKLIGKEKDIGRIVNYKSLVYEMIIYDSLGYDEYLAFRSKSIRKTNKKEEKNKNIKRISVVGSGGVGKTSIFNRFCHDFFEEEFIPTIEDCNEKEINVNGKLEEFEILDVAGEEEYTALRGEYYPIRRSNGFLLCCSMTEKSSFKDIKDFLKQIVFLKDVESPLAVPIVFVANKIDVPDDFKIQKKEALKVFRSLVENNVEVPVLFTSAKKDVNIKEAFESLAKRMFYLKEGKIVLHLMKENFREVFFKRILKVNKTNKGCTLL